MHKYDPEDDVTDREIGVLFLVLGILCAIVFGIIICLSNW